MNNHLIDIDIPHGFRAIQEAHIHLDGIAVVSGINGCGKSTLSKLLYETFKHTLQYESIVISEINDRLSPYREVLAQMQMQMGAVNNERRVAYRLFFCVKGKVRIATYYGLKIFARSLERKKKSATMLTP